MLPTVAQAVKINPEQLAVANSYLALGSAEHVARELDLPLETVSAILDQREVKSYVDRVFFDAGYNNRAKMTALMEALINKKLQELDEAGTGSNKDITEILTLQHKFTMDWLAKDIELEKAKRGSAPTNQTNVQINGDASNYGSLISKIIDASKQ